ncbi:MAG: MBL fold metallo-hydrolase [Phycisphaerales bacterium]|nr:MBL fold metallo-hydrolase [Phycisphaerales bacterium]
MRIQFSGANRTVTGSCHVLELNGRRIVLDFGLYQGRREESRLLNEQVADELISADAVILSHGHLDHCGRLPILTRMGYRGPIYLTPATAAVTRVVLQDAAQIQEEDAAYLNRRGRAPGVAPVEPLYQSADLPAVYKAFRPVNYGIKTDLGNGVSFSFHDAGHILGSAYIALNWVEKDRPRSLLFTADVGRYGMPILHDPVPLSQNFDHIITESTYGDRAHEPVSQIEPQFLDAIKTVIARGGRLIIPSFAVGRTQTMLWYLQKFINEKLIPELPIFVDSPMGVQVSEVYDQYRENYDTQTHQMIGRDGLFNQANITFAVSSEQSKQINRVNQPCVIVASSPSCEFGRVLHHLKRSLENERDMVLFVGWVPPQTLGRRLQQAVPRLRVYDRWYDRKIEVRTLHGLSAHADYVELLRFLAPTLKPQTTAFVVHGEADQADAFAARLVSAGVGQAVVPALSTTNAA